MKINKNTIYAILPVFNLNVFIVFDHNDYKQ